MGVQLTVPVGTRFGRWVTSSECVLRERRKGRDTYVQARCDCGSEREVMLANLRRGVSRSCGCLKNEITRKRHSTIGQTGAWLGEAWFENRQGYMVVSMPTPDGRSTTLRRNRLTMEQHLGRPLRPEETVHHINGVKTDDRIENLELWSGSHPKGQRVADKVNWAKEILALYGEDFADADSGSRT